MWFYIYIYIYKRNSSQRKISIPSSLSFCATQETHTLTIGRHTPKWLALKILDCEEVSYATIVEDSLFQRYYDL